VLEWGTCERFQVKGIPCGPAIALLYRLHGQLRDFSPSNHYRDTYSDNVKAIDVNITSLPCPEELAPQPE